MAEAALFERLGGRERFQTAETRLVGRPADDPDSAETSVAELRVTVKDPDPAKVGRAFSNAAIELALANYPGCYTTTPPADATPYGIYWPALVRADRVEQVVVLPDGHRLPVKPPPAPTPRAPGSSATAHPDPPGGGAPEREGSPPPRSGDPAVHSPPASGSGDPAVHGLPASGSGDPAVHGLPADPAPPSTHRPAVRAPLGRVFGARSGDKGGTANVGVWARTDEAYRFLEGFLTVERFRELIPEARGLDVRRYELPNLLALNFVVAGLLGEGVSSTTRIDPQAKGLGEWLRARVVDLPAELLEQGG
jgi:hypothetical protein